MKPQTLKIVILVLLSLAAAAVTFAMLAHALIAGLEDDMGTQMYESVAVSAVEGAQLRAKFVLTLSEETQTSGIILTK